MFSKDDLVAYFGDRYSEEQIIKAVQVVAEKRSDIDPNGNDFPEEIIEELEAIFNAIGAAVEQQQKKIAGSDGGKIERIDMGAIAQQAHQSLIAQDILISEERLMVIAQAMIGGILEQANILGMIAERTLLNSLQLQQNRIAERLTIGMIEGAKRVKEIFNEENLQEIVNASAPSSQPFDVNEFIRHFKEEKKQREQEKKIQEIRRQEQVAAKKKLDIKAFLDEMGK